MDEHRFQWRWWIRLRHCRDSSSVAKEQLPMTRDCVFVREFRMCAPMKLRWLGVQRRGRASGMRRACWGMFALVWGGGGGVWAVLGGLG